MATVGYLSLLVIILLIRGVTISLVNFIIFSQYIHLFYLCILNSSFLTIEIVIYVPVTIWWKVLFVVSWKTSAFSLVTFIGNRFCLRNSIYVLIQRTGLELRYETTLLLGSDRTRLFGSLIWIKNDGIWRPYTIGIYWWKRLRCFYTDLLSIKILRRTIAILRRRNVLNEIVLISRRIHLLLILNKRIVYILLFLTWNVDFMSSAIHWWFQINVLVIRFVILWVNSSLGLVNSVVIFRSIKVLSSVVHYVLGMDYITFSVNFTPVEF